MDEKATNYNPDADLSDSTLCQYDTSGDATNLENEVQSAAEDGLLGMPGVDNDCHIWWRNYCSLLTLLVLGEERRDVWF